MASIFTFDPDPPRVASPWLRNGSESAVEQQGDQHPTLGPMRRQKEALPARHTNAVRASIPRLEAEPQEGPVEYKLHLLLRPRRRFESTSTSAQISGSRHSKLGSTNTTREISESILDHSLTSDSATPSSASVQQTRQHRLEQLTTQLLWRLQQSSPHHTSSATNTILPSLPEALPELEAPVEPAKLLHGLEESRGALYEIGVSDDGTLVGLAEDEMHESLTNLRAMAACLGCTVEVLRQEIVGSCEWIEDVMASSRGVNQRRSGNLVVVEAFVKPYLHAASPTSAERLLPQIGKEVVQDNDRFDPSSTEQIRITLTGPTMSGKSSLLGTLTTSTLDNGRGKSRLSMLKHRHEISTGVTSSVSQELLGYQDAAAGAVEVVNYATENVTSWIDIHVAAHGGRLVLISDSAGHPRYRRTTVRGLVGWAPHWTLLCVPADDTETITSISGSTNTSQQNMGHAFADLDLSRAQLELCLRLRLPLVIVITKLDLASKSGLKSSLSKVLDALKAFGRKAAIMANSPGATPAYDLQIIEAAAIDKAYNFTVPLLNDPIQTVPIVLTSAVHGTGIKNLHAFLHQLPIPDILAGDAQGSAVVFHIEDIYNKPADSEGVIVSGRLRCGQICAGDTGALGPFSVHELDDPEDSDDRSLRRPSSQLPSSRSFPGALRREHLCLPRFQLPSKEWRRFSVLSVRNLKFPVRSLSAGQVGTVAIVPESNEKTPTPFTGIRKGMVLTSVQPLATRSFVAKFSRGDLESLAVGNHVVVYIASVRASAKVVSARAPESPVATWEPDEQRLTADAPFGFEDADLNESAKVAGMVTAPHLLVTFSLDASKEFVMVGDQILVMPGGGPGLYGGQARGQKGVAGLEGFVGHVTEIHG